MTVTPAVAAGAINSNNIVYPQPWQPQPYVPSPWPNVVPSTTYIWTPKEKQLDAELEALNTVIAAIDSMREAWENIPEEADERVVKYLEARYGITKEALDNILDLYPTRPEDESDE